jgi:hypothetical protein
VSVTASAFQILLGSTVLRALKRFETELLIGRLSGRPFFVYNKYEP